MTELQKDLDTIRYAIDRVIRRFAVPDAKPLFTTEDGVDVFSGDSFFCVTDDFQILKNDLAQQSHVGVRLRAFATIPAAEVWVLMNKPCLSVMDVDSAYTFAPKCSPLHEDLMLNLEAIAKSRI